MINLFTDFFADLRKFGLGKYEEFFQEALLNQIGISEKNRQNWFNALNSLPEVFPSEYCLNSSEISAGRKTELSSEQLKILNHSLTELCPWRKGPFRLFDTFIDTEWRSDWKWNRISDKISPLKDKKVLDIGCGNGYHMWRMLGDGAKLVVGADPSFQFLAQFLTIKKYIKDQPIHLLPLGFEHLPASMPEFDSVFSMGILYHRRSPIDFLKSIRTLLKPDGELVLETLVIEGGDLEVLVPPGRYAQMNNVWFIPTPNALMTWLRKCGYKNPQLINLSKTTVEEQRATKWMTSHSLSEFLDPDDCNKTIEGHPSPIRATIIAKK